MAPEHRGPRRDVAAGALATIPGTRSSRPTPRRAPFLCKLARRGDGVTALEYALIAAAVAVVIVAAVQLLGNNVANVFNQVAAGF
jgi:pilus assembly protein Flp/PilA